MSSRRVFIQKVKFTPTKQPACNKQVPNKKLEIKKVAKSGPNQVAKEPTETKKPVENLASLQKTPTVKDQPQPVTPKESKTYAAAPLEALVCPVCLEQFDLAAREPRCLTNLAKRAASTGQKTITCPLDSMSASLPSDMIKGFPRNYVVISAIEELQKKSPVSKNCARAKCKAPATIFCLECNKELCESCSTILHEVFEDHHPVSISSKTTPIRDKDKKNRPICRSHPPNELKLFCAKCELPICYLCSLFEHKNHAKQFPDLSKNLEIIRNNTTRECKTLSLAIKYLSNIIATSSKSEINNNAETARRLLKQWYDAEIASLTSIYNTKMKTLNLQIEQAENTVEKALTENRASLAALTEKHRLLSSLLEAQSTSDMISYSSRKTKEPHLKLHSKLPMFAVKHNPPDPNRHRFATDRLLIVQAVHDTWNNGDAIWLKLCKRCRTQACGNLHTKRSAFCARHKHFPGSRKKLPATSPKLPKEACKPKPTDSTESVNEIDKLNGIKPHQPSCNQSDIEVVMKQANVDRATAEKALQEKKGDLVEAIMQLHNTLFREQACFLNYELLRSGSVQSMSIDVSIGDWSKLLQSASCSKDYVRSTANFALDHSTSARLLHSTLLEHLHSVGDAAVKRSALLYIIDCISQISHKKTLNTYRELFATSMITMTHEFPPEDPCLKKVLKVWQEHNVYSEEVLRGAREHVSCHCENRRQAPKPTLTETKATATIDSTARKRREEAEITRKIEEFRRESKRRRLEEALHKDDSVSEFDKLFDATVKPASTTSPQSYQYTQHQQQTSPASSPVQRSPQVFGTPYSPTSPTFPT